MNLKKSLISLLFTFISLASTANTLTFSTLTGMQMVRACSQILMEAYQHIGIKINIKTYPARRALILSNSGKTDGEVIRPIGAEQFYPNLVRVPVQLCATQSHVYSKQKEFKVTGWQSLKPYKIGIIRGHLYAQKGTQGMNIVTIRNNNLLFQMLERGRIDVAIAQTADADNIIAQLHLKGIKKLQPAIANIPLFHYLHKKNIALIPKIEAALKKLRASGRSAQIQHNFIQRQAIHHLSLYKYQSN